jgi:hypothetical protein
MRPQGKAARAVNLCGGMQNVIPRADALEMTLMSS